MEPNFGFLDLYLFVCLRLELGDCFILFGNAALALQLRINLPIDRQKASIF